MDLWTQRAHIEETFENLLNNSLDIDIDDEFQRLDDIHNTINRQMFDIYRLSTFLVRENNLHKHPPQMLITDAEVILPPVPDPKVRGPGNLYQHSREMSDR